MARWQLDSRRFAEDVFVPVRAGWDPARNLFRFFQLPLDVRDDDVVEAAVRAVDAHVKRCSLAGAHAVVATSLRPGFDEFAATVRAPGPRARHRDQVLAEHRAFALQIREEMRGMPALRPAEIDAHAARLHPRLVRREVEEMVTRAGIQVRDPAPLDVPPLPPGWRDTRLALRQAGRSTLAEYLASYDLGPASTPDDVRRVRALLDRRRGGADLTAEETVLSEISRLIGAAELAGALRRETIDELTDAAGLGPDALRSHLARADVRARVAGSGLPPDDDLFYALLCRARPAGASDPRWQADLERARADRDLHAVQDLLAGRPGLPDELVELRERTTDAIDRVRRSLSAARDLEATDPEAAAATYLDVLRLAAEPEAVAGLLRCRPPAPPAAAAEVIREQVTVSWNPAPARAGRLGYRVERHVAGGPDAGRTTVGETEGGSLLDPAPPAATAIRYHVTTVRSGALSAQTATTGPVVVLPPVTGLTAEAGDGLVTLRWSLPERALTARVQRSDGDRLREVGAARTSCLDPDARSGIHYSYSVAAVYDIDGSRVHGPAIEVRAFPQVMPVPVADLTVTGDGNGRCTASWSAPATGRVELRWWQVTPPPPGTVLSAEADLGRPARVIGSAPAGVQIDPAPGLRRGWWVPITVSGELAAVGAAVEQDLRLPPVSDLRARMQGDLVRVTWTWPDTTGAAVVLVGDRVVTGTELRATGTQVPRAGYEHSGCRLPVPVSGTVWVAVALIAREDGADVVGPVSRVRLAAPRTLVYDVVPAGRGRRALVVRGAAPLPTVEIRARVGHPPLRREDGHVLLTLQPDTVDADRMSAEFAPGRARPLHLRVFAVDPSDEVRLVCPDPDRLRIDRRWWR